LSSTHNPSEIQRWEDLTGLTRKCCIKKSAKVVYCGVNKGKKINKCHKTGFAGVHVKFAKGKNKKKYIIPVCRNHNDDGLNTCFLPGSIFLSNKTTAVLANSKQTNKSYIKKKRRRNKGPKRSRKKKIPGRRVKPAG